MPHTKIQSSCSSNGDCQTNQHIEHGLLNRKPDLLRHTLCRSSDKAVVLAVLLPERRSAGVNATVRKASAGAYAHIPIARVSNVADTLRKLKKASVWVAGADLSEGSVEYAKADLSGDLAIVIGAEGKGLSPVARKECDFLVRIPMLGSVESLNASVAAAVLLYEAVRQRRDSKG